MPTQTATVTLQYVLDAEGSGECGNCDRTGLRWLAVLSNGSTVGLECAKKVMGYRPSPKSYNWVADFTLVATHLECGTVWGMWQHKSGVQTRETVGGALMSVGGVRANWTRRGWDF